MKKFAFSFDEGELQANYEQSFLILFNLNQRVIPSLYVLMWLVGLLTTMNVVSAYIVLTIIFIYINVMFYPMVKKYFK